MTALPLIDRPLHRQWLAQQVFDLVRFHRTGDGSGGFASLAMDGTALAGGRFQLHDVTRLVHCFALAKQLGIPGLDAQIDQGMRFITSAHHDPSHGGYYWAVNTDGAVVSDKLAYGHAFVLLAASSALRVGHPMAQALLTDITNVINTRFWDDTAGAVIDEFHADWSDISNYRGQNSNMHMTEALMAAFDVTGDRQYLIKAKRIADLIINRHARACGWRVAEHFTRDWAVDLTYEGDPMFRPAGTTPGHALEWSRLLLQLWDLDGRTADWMVEASQGLFHTTTRDGWNADQGGFHYTLDWHDQPLQTLRLWWPNAEAIGAAALLWRMLGDTAALAWYDKVWDVVARSFIDTKHGGWFPELDAAGQPTEIIFKGKPDLYHAFQACLIPLLPAGVHLSSNLCGALA